MTSQDQGNGMRGIGGIAAWGAGLALVGIVAALVATSFGAGGGDKPTAQAAMASCPPVVSIAPRGPGQPPDDIVGVRLGYTIADVRAELACLDDGYKFRFEPVWHTMDSAAPRDRHQLLYAERANEMLAAGLVGAPGQERTAALWRTVRYSPAEAPERAAVETELTRHFGPPSQIDDTPTRRRLVWAFDPNGLPIKASSADGAAGVLQRVGDWIAGAVTIPQCADHIRISPLDRPDFDKSCGLTVRAEIEPLAEDARKAGEVRVALADQARAKGLIDAYRTAAKAQQ